MTTLQSYEGVGEIFQRLQAVRSRQWAFRVATGIVAVLAVVPASLLVVAASAGYWREQPPAVLRWALLSLTCLGWAFALVWFVFRALAWKQNTAQIARFVEQATPELRNDLINSVLLCRDPQQVSPDLVQQAIHEAIRHSRRMDLSKSISLKPLQRWGLAAALSALALTCFGIFQPRILARGLMAVLKPTGYVSTQGTVEILKVTPGDATVYANDSVTITAEVRNEKGDQYPAEVVVDGAKNPRKMVASLAYTYFTAQLGRIDQTTRYAVYVGDTRWPTDRKWYTITVLQRVQVERTELRYDYPGYIGWDRKVIDKADGEIHAPQGTLATVVIHLSSPVPRAVMYLKGALAPVDGKTEPPGGERMAVMGPEPDGKSFSARIPVDADGFYRIEFLNNEGRTVGRLPSLGQADGDSPTPSAEVSGSFRIQALPDTPPKITFVEPNCDSYVPTGGKLKMKVKVYDKYGLTAATLWYGPESQEQRTEVKFAPPEIAGKKELTFEYTLDLGAFQTNSILEYYGTVTDNRNLPHLKLGPQTTPSKRFRVTIQDPTVLAEQRAQGQEQLRQRLMAILEMQIGENVNAQICRDAKTLQELRNVGGQLFAGQKKIRDELDNLATKFPFEPDMASIKVAVSELAANEAVLAINQAQVVAALNDLASRKTPCQLVLDTQGQIIEALKNLLAIMPALAQKPDQKTEKPADDLTSDVKDAMDKLKKELSEFIEEQRKVIKASERLAKKPADAFTPDDEKLLKDLQATEDKWEKFINEAITDFSKLLQQDFANPQLLKELVAVKTDVTMAKDALKKKATEIATAAEDNGIENAKSLTANLEKWLPDEPDRIKWSMEDMDTSKQDNIEQAELPTELEDLVGDLLEQEEDLFDEMDDVSSKSTMSGDKGIGWDAMDGPISNMNAQGVTGNQLPNTSEIHGRSGEGRTGKATGEFVEDKAVGKGGRRTPTRLSPEPFQKGQVNDTSTEPPGGATGGGKLSGSGEEGLEGPIPPPVAQEMKRLAGKQASLLNRAERVRAGLKPTDMSHFKLMQAMTLMDRVFNDLRNYRYQNVLRARHATLKALSEIGNMKTGQIDVSIDTSTNMPKYIRDNIADAMKGNLPEEYREALEKYYRRIGEIGTSP